MTWQPDGWNDDMSEAPKDGMVLLSAFCRGRWFVTAGGYDGHWTGKMWVYENKSIPAGTEPTHWRYLPSPPSKQED